MPVILLPCGVVDAGPMQCRICRKYLPLSHLSAGMCDAQGNQTFFCDAHYTDLSRLILGWTDYMVAERQLNPFMLDLFEEAYGG